MSKCATLSASLLIKSLLIHVIFNVLISDLLPHLLGHVFLVSKLTLQIMKICLQRRCYGPWYLHFHRISRLGGLAFRKMQSLENLQILGRLWFEVSESGLNESSQAYREAFLQVVWASSRFESVGTWQKSAGKASLNHEWYLLQCAQVKSHYKASIHQGARMQFQLSNVSKSCFDWPSTLCGTRAHQASQTFLQEGLLMRKLSQVLQLAGLLPRTSQSARLLLSSVDVALENATEPPGKLSKQRTDLTWKALGHSQLGPPSEISKHLWEINASVDVVWAEVSFGNSNAFKKLGSHSL